MGFERFVKMKVALLFLAILGTVSAQSCGTSVCCLESCPDDVEQDGNCCPVGSTCCSFQGSNQQGSFFCCRDGVETCDAISNSCVPMISPSPAPPTPGMSCDICCLANGACPPGADPDGNCCPFGKTCCAFDQSVPNQPGNFGCCDTTLGFTCQVTGGVGQCKGGIIPPTPPPTPVPSSTCKPGDTPWEPPQECYSPWVGNCGVGSYCHPSSGTTNNSGPKAWPLATNSLRVILNWDCPQPLVPALVTPNVPLARGNQSAPLIPSQMIVASTSISTAPAGLSVKPCYL